MGTLPFVAPRIDWKAVKATYVEGVRRGDETVWLSLDEVAARHATNASNVRKRAGRESWTTEQAAFRRRIEYERQTQRANEIARIGADLDVHALQLARAGMSIVAARVQELGAAATLRAKRLNDNPDSPAVGEPLDSLEMDRLSRSAAEWYGLGVRAIGEAPKLTVQIETDDEQTPVEERDAIALGVMGILSQHAPDLMPPELMEAIDVGSRIRAVAGGGEVSNSGPADTEDEQLHSADADGR